jgi:hypothetical protein
MCARGEAPGGGHLTSLPVERPDGGMAGAGDFSCRHAVIESDKLAGCGDVRDYPGELVFADFDRNAVIPGKAESEVVQLAKVRVGTMSLTRGEPLQGATLRVVFSKSRLITGRAWPMNRNWHQNPEMRPLKLNR